jgi:hypothetical protein
MTVTFHIQKVEVLIRRELKLDTPYDKTANSYAKSIYKNSLGKSSASNMYDNSNYEAASNYRSSNNKLFAIKLWQKF